MTRDTLVAIGEALIDFMPDRAGCAFAEVGAFSPKLGGAPANVCGAYAKLGGKARMLTQLGDDPFGHKILEELRQAGIDVGCIRLTDEANTALAFVSSGINGERTFSFYRKPSADMLYKPEYVTADALGDAYALHFCSVSLGDFPMKQAHTAAIERARAQGSIVSFDPNLRFPLWNDRTALHDTVLAFLPLADVVKISDEELEFLTGTDDIRAALPRLLVGNVKLVLYTLGKDGAMALTAERAVRVDGLPGKAVDTTGAGDGFAGSFLWMLHRLGVDRDGLASLSDETLRACLRFSNAFCTRSVQQRGAIASYPALEDVLADVGTTLPKEGNV